MFLKQLAADRYHHLHVCCVFCQPPCWATPEILKVKDGKISHSLQQ